MERAFELAKEALNSGEVPVGCVIVAHTNTSPFDESQKEEATNFQSSEFNNDQQVSQAPTGLLVGEGRNQVNLTKNATRHAEIVAIERAHALCADNGWDFTEICKSATLFVTVEPCIMCAGALQSVGIGKIIFGCRNERFGGLGSVLNVYQNADITEGVRKEEAIDLLKQFYIHGNPLTETDDK